MLGKLFGSHARVKLMRLFLLNSEEVFENKDIVKRSRVTISTVRKEVALLYRSGFIRKKGHTKISIPKRKNGKPMKRRITGWQLDPNYPFMGPLKELLLDSEPLQQKEIANKFRKAGQIKLIVISGMFIKEDDSRVDILVVGDKLKKPIIETALKNIEAEVGKELSYAFFETDEFKYRVGICDKFVRDVLDYPHKKIINKINI